MHSHAIHTSRLDRLAMGISGLCLVHCIGTAILVALLASAGGILGRPIIHQVGLSLAIAVGAFALGKGFLEHGFMLPAAVGSFGIGVMAGALSLPEGGHEPLYTMTGVMIVALGHRLNIIASHGKL